ncbi:MAG: leucine-rich repeat domain-containing protein [Dysgonamonadaceae bacterium]|jgi:hypothetical protein|nr:leucine-rich repeat domain-containing protein [Dysgonamonadaceae bacterium]
MKKIISFLLPVYFLLTGTSVMNAQVLTVAHNTEGSMNAEITAVLGSQNAADIETLIVNGTANLTLSDCNVIRDVFKTTLDTLDLSGAHFADNKTPNGDGTTGAFLGMKIVKAILPADLSIVGNHSFRDCNMLETVVFPEGLITLGTYSFYQCSKLNIFTLPETVSTIGERAFMNCSSLELSKLPSSLSGTIGQRTFQQCTKITINEIPSGITTIMDLAFYGCTSIASIKFSPDTITVGARIFEGCSGLTSITFKGYMRNLKDDTFKNCTELISIYFNGDTPPPTTDANAFTGATLSNITVYVPDGSQDNFNISPWKDMKDIAVNQSTSIRLPESVNGMYSNPTEDNVIVVDLSGRIVATDTNVSHLPKGIYILKNGSYIHKFVKK